jgi:hypothetical protein
MSGSILAQVRSLNPVRINPAQPEPGQSCAIREITVQIPASPGPGRFVRIFYLAQETYTI